MRKILALVLDTASPALIEKWTDDGTLPNLAQLRQRGAYGRLESPAEWMAEAVPFAFFTGQNPAATGLHSSTVWQKETMTARQPGPDWLPYKPFWRSFREGGPRAVVLDPANVYPPEPFHGAEVIGWATQHLFIPYQTYPPELAAWIHSRFGSSLLPDEIYGMSTRQEFLRERERMLELNSKFSELCLALMQKEHWNLFLATNFTLHHAGHRLWNTTNVSEPLSESQALDMNDSLRQIYVACDEAVGRLVDAVDRDTLVMVISLHGMDVNNSRTWIFPEMLARVLGGAPSRPDLLRRLREAIPVRWRHAVKSQLPRRARRGLTRFWVMKDYDWTKTRAFAPLSDTQGWVRINLRGREAQGIVEPEGYDALCQEISEGVRTFVDADTGEPVVKDVIRTSQVFEGDRLAELPDVIVRWAESPASMHRAISSPRFGVIPWPTPGRNPEGRSGNHRGQGILIAAGSGVKQAEIRNAGVLDLVPTMLSLLGQPVPPEMEGKPLRLVE